MYLYVYTVCVHQTEETTQSQTLDVVMQCEVDKYSIHVQDDQQVRGGALLSSQWLQRKLIGSNDLIPA